MKWMDVLLRELRMRWFNAAVTLGGLAVAIALVVVVRMVSSAMERETRRVMRDMGFNLRIVPRATHMERFWMDGFSDAFMPEQTIRTLAAQKGIFLSFNHLTPMLEFRQLVGRENVLVTGMGKTIVGGEDGKQAMGFNIQKRTAYVGFILAQKMSLERGSRMMVGTNQFTVERVMAESGADDDIRVFLSLEDAQTLLGTKGVINEIRAIDCLCLTADKDPLVLLQKTIEDVLPDVRVVQMRAMADARAKQRQMVEKLTQYLIPFSITAGALWIVVLGVWNVRERTTEIGLWRALGYGSTRIGALVLGRCAVLGFAGGLLGYIFGTWLALGVGPDIFKVTAKALKIDWAIGGWTICLSPLCAVIAGLVPALNAVSKDPVEALRAE